MENCIYIFSFSNMINQNEYNSESQNTSVRDVDSINKEKALDEQFAVKKNAIANKYWEKVAVLCQEAWDKIGLELHFARKLYHKDEFLQLPPDENLFHYLFKNKAEQTDKKFGNEVSVPLVKAWNSIDQVQNVMERIALRTKILNLQFFTTEFWNIGIRGIPWFDRAWKLFSMWWIHPSLVMQQFSEETKKHAKWSVFEKMRRVIIHNLMHHELWEKEGDDASLKKHVLNEDVASSSFIIPATHAIRHLSESQMKEFFMTQDDVRELEDWASYHLPLLIELLKIKMVYQSSSFDPDVQYSHILLANKEKFPGSAMVRKIAKKNDFNQLYENEYVSKIKPANMKKPMLVYGFLNEKKTVENNTTKTESQLSANLNK